LLAANVLVVGFTITLLTVSGLRSAQRDSADRVMDQRTAVARWAVTAETGRYLSLLQALAAGLGTDARFTRDDFDGATAPLAAAGLLGATSIAFVVPSPRGQDAQTQAYWRARGAAGLVVSPKGNPPEHLYSIFSRTLNTAGPPLNGVDVTASAEASVALGEARRTGKPAVSDTYILLRDRGQPRSHQQLSFVFAAPVTTAKPESTFLGWLVLGLHGQDFLGGMLSTASQGQLDGELYATNGDGRQVEVASYLAPGDPNLTRRVTFPVANREWTLQTRADSAYLPGARSNLPVIVGLGGITLTILLAWLVHILASGRSRARNQVEVATAELRTAEAESRRQAGLLGAIMASIGDGVGVVDSKGAFLLHNPAAKALLGVEEDIDGPQEWQSAYGLYRADGRTPFPVEDMPLVRALAGESSDGVEMLIRNAARPDGILVSVDGRPLDPSAGLPGAVAVFHDITELRRYEQDLSVFAGVVAHDLKAPLAIIHGHCETALEDLTDSPETADARTALTRIAAGVDRMAGLIDTLLAYTTSRDAPLHIEVVPLGPLVEDVAAGRTGHLRASDPLAPDIYVGPLPEVEADPAMLRHVIDNLIGNALKYVPPGRSPRVDVTAEPGAPGWTRVEIADRGIGIPDDDKPNIFESFHRARTAAGYAGTGLGLAICRRIIERHGGAIGVGDNPGGGTRFHFTLPLPVSAPPTEEVIVSAPSLPPGPPGGGPDEDAPERAELERTLADQAALARALAQRDAIERTALPGLLGGLPPAGGSSRHTSASARPPAG
jgi:signal transduction histidine kinase